MLTASQLFIVWNKSISVLFSGFYFLIFITSLTLCRRMRNEMWSFTFTFPENVSSDRELLHSSSKNMLLSQFISIIPFCSLITLSQGIWPRFVIFSVEIWCKKKTHHKCTDPCERYLKAQIFLGFKVLFEFEFYLCYDY